MNQKMKAATLCVQAGWEPKNGESRVLPIYQSTTFKYDNTEEMALCMERLVSDANLRQKLVAGGIEWAARFSWEKTAQETLAVLQSVAKK